VLDLRLRADRGGATVLAIPVAARDATAGTGGPVRPRVDAGADRATELVVAFLADVEHSGAAGAVHPLPRPGLRPNRLLLFGIGSGGAAAWRTAGAALARAARRDVVLEVLLPAGLSSEEIRGLAEGCWLASYRYRVGADDAARAPRLRRIDLITSEPAAAAAVTAARAVAKATLLARDLTNTSSDRKSPAWLARQVEKAAAGIPGLSVSVRDRAALEREGFGGVLAVGRGSVSQPRFVELSWRPRGAQTHVVLVGKGITFDTGGICIKPREGMKLMRKDMAGAAAVLAATIAVADRKVPVRVTALAPLAENSIGGDAYRPGDVITHYGGRTTEVTNTDAEGRIVLADALAYAAQRLRPDVVVDLATLTGAQGVALGKRTAALYSESDALAGSLAVAAEAAGEKVWRMPLPDEYLAHLDSDVADLTNSSDQGAGSVTAALYLREFTGSARARWAHFDLASPSWAEGPDGELTKGATGWGVRTLLRWLDAIAESPTTALP
jgi:leucyl aminopeptidase